MIFRVALTASNTLLRSFFSFAVIESGEIGLKLLHVIR